MRSGGTDKRLIPDKNTVKMRLYSQGLGDCFLLAFPRKDGDSPCYMVIDCGCAKGTPDEKGRMKAVVADIIEATGGKIDVLAITHQHYDHIIGFRHAFDLWNGAKIESLWLPWTEIKGDVDAAKVQQKRKALNDATVKAMARAQDPAAQNMGFGVTDEDGTLRAEAGFLGITLGADDSDTESGGGFSIIQDAFGKALGLLKEGKPVYCEPGDVLRLPGSDFHAFVLGPPRETALIDLLVDESEMYHYTDIGMSADPTGRKSKPAFQMRADAESEGLAAAIGGIEGDKSGERYCPFDSQVRLDWDQAMLQPFFDTYYAGDSPWRRVDDDWLDGAANLGLQAGNYTNNISLVLAFEMPNSKRVLLFPGDAQVGNWLSWHNLSQWRPVGTADTPQTAPSMTDLLGRVAFYKVGHHGSHNATIKDKGLELMPDGILAYIPVSVPIAHDVMGYCPMPFYPVVRRLQAKTGGRLFLSNGQLVEPLPPTAKTADLQKGVLPAPAGKTLPEMVKNGVTLEKEVPLYLEVTMDDGPPGP